MAIKKQQQITADEWFRQGRRVRFDPATKKIVDHNHVAPNAVVVFERVTPSNGEVDPQQRWVTMMPGFPDGSFGWSRVEKILKANETATPRLYVEYVGQGDSDKPSKKKYHYSTMERADLVEAQWRAHNVRRTVLATFDYSSIVMLELLQRQRERIDNGEKLDTVIEHVLSINGGLFADGHSHPWTTTPLLKTRMGGMGTWAAQRSRFVFDTMLTPLFDKEYGVSKKELGEINDAITRRNGAAFMSNAAEFVDEHKRNANRWDLKEIYLASRGEGITFRLVGSEKDQFEYKQIIKARERLGSYADVDIQKIPGGHMSTSEQPETLARFVQELANK